jgi:hypothetical protein
MKPPRNGKISTLWESCAAWIVVPAGAAAATLAIKPVKISASSAVTDRRRLCVVFMRQSVSVAASTTDLTALQANSPDPIVSGHLAACGPKTRAA